MAGLVPAIHVLQHTRREGVDGRVKPGHDVESSERNKDSRKAEMVQIEGNVH